MADTPPTRSVKISQDERGGWSSDRPRPGGGPPRPANRTVRCQVLSPAESLRYSPGSLLVVVSAGGDEAAGLAGRVIQDPASLLSLDRVRSLLAGRVPDEELGERSAELLDAAALKRLEAGEAVVIVTAGIEADERERYVGMASRFRRPCHLVLVETGSDGLSEEERGSLNKLRRRLEAGELGEEGFNTVVRVGGASLSDLRRVVFEPAPSDD